MLEQPIQTIPATSEDQAGISAAAAEQGADSSIADTAEEVGRHVSLLEKLIPSSRISKPYQPPSESEDYAPYSRAAAKAKTAPPLIDQG